MRGSRVWPWREDPGGWNSKSLEVQSSGIKSPSKGAGGGVERQLVREPHCQKGSGCRVTWRPLVPAAHREVGGSSLTACVLKRFGEVYPGRVDEEQGRQPPPLQAQV